MSDEPQITNSELQAYADGRLGEERSRAVEAWLAARPDDAERIAAYRRLGEELRRAYDPVLDEPLPDWLGGGRAPRPRWHGFARIAGWVVLGAAIGVVAGWEVRDARPVAASRADPGETMAHRAAVAHAVYSPEVRHPVEVGAAEQEHLVNWLSKRVGAKLRAPVLTAEGYELVGGRLLPGESGAVAQFMYQDGKGKRLTLYVSRLAGKQRDTAFRFSQEDKVSVFYWIDGALGYALSGELPKADLLNIATTVYKQINP